MRIKKMITFVIVGAMTICCVPAMNAGAKEQTPAISVKYSAADDNVIEGGVIYTVYTEDEAEVGTAVVYDTTEEFKKTGTKVNIPPTVNYNGKDYPVVDIGSSALHPAFTGCEMLEEVTIPDSVKIIGIGAFSNCPRLKKIEIPDSVTEIGYQAFLGCTSLAEVKLPDNPGFTALEPLTFAQCRSLDEISIPKSVTAISDDIFSDMMEESWNVNVIGYMDSAAEVFAGTDKTRFSFTPVDGIMNDLFRIKFPESCVGKFIGVPIDEDYGIAVYSNKCYEERNGDGGWICSVTVDQYGRYEDKYPQCSVLEKSGGQTYVLVEPTEMQVDIQGQEPVYNFSQEATDEYYEIIGPVLEAADTIEVTKAPGKSGVKGVKNIKSKKMKVTLSKAKKITGCEIEYSTSTKFTNPKYKKTKKSSYTFKKLKK
ncbi:MAG: leucine-rich repeat domain-containing protein, partial [Eubacterium sp.]|nr:leucine-rich repeat domain-containing protein [Eubacterium sp.]